MITSFIFFFTVYIEENKSDVSYYRNFPDICFEYLYCALRSLARLLERTDESTIDFCITWACRAFRIRLERNGFHRIACK